MLNEYSMVKSLFIRFNTTLPSLAASKGCLAKLAWMDKIKLLSATNTIDNIDSTFEKLPT